MLTRVLSKKLLTLGLSATLAVTGGYLIGPLEGMSNQAYKDIVGVPTVCFGVTNGVKMGDYKTTEQCERDLAKELVVYNRNMKKHVKVELFPYEEIAYTSFVWNLGETNFKNSTLLKKLNAGDREGACQELLKWNRAGGKEVRGLTNRRLHEQKVCLGKDEKVNEALKALEASKTSPEAFKQGSLGMGSQEPIKVVVEPSNPLTTAYQDPPGQVCSVRFLGICFNKSK